MSNRKTPRAVTRSDEFSATRSEGDALILAWMRQGLGVEDIKVKLSMQYGIHAKIETVRAAVKRLRHEHQ